MKVSTKNSQKLYKDFDVINIDYLKTWIEKNYIKEEIVEELLKYWDSRLSNPRDVLYENYIDYYLFYESVNSGIALSFIYDYKKNKTMHKYGILTSSIQKIISEIKKNTIQKKENEKFIYKYHDFEFEVWNQKVNYDKNSFLLCVVYPVQVDISKTLKRIENVFMKFYLTDILHPDLRFLSIFEKINNEMMVDIRQTQEKKIPITFSYLKFEKLNRYISLAGGILVSEIFKGLKENVLERLEKGDKWYVINPREYLLVSLNCREEELKKKYKRMNVKIKGLMLKYKIKFTTILDPIEDMNHIWDKISIKEEV